jgi:hypothetical protein
MRSDVFVPRRRTFLALLSVVGLCTLLGCPPGGGTGGNPQQWFTGFSHSTVWGAFATTTNYGSVPSTSCFTDTPHRVEPAEFWNGQPVAITNHSDAVGTVFWSSTIQTCPRAMQYVYRSILIADLSTFYPKFPAGTAQVGNRISKATLQFNVIPMTTNTITTDFPCDPFIGAAAKVNVVQRNAVVYTAGQLTAVNTSWHAGLIQASPTGGPNSQPPTGPNTLAAMPLLGDEVADLSQVHAAGTFNNGALAVTTNGPNIQAVTIDVTKWVRGATNLTLPFIAFSIGGMFENSFLTISQPIQRECRDWIEPTQLHIDFS